VAYDTELADRVREQLANETAVSEQAMFGGLAFLLRGNMAVAVSSHGGLLVRVPPEDVDRALSKPHVQILEMRNRPMAGWVRVAPEGVRTARQLASWVELSVAYAGALPPKGASKPRHGRPIPRTATA
jgi:TfoX/Sxy family transcriptional regulator of competence genes